MDQSARASRPLSGIRVIALEAFVAGPLATMFLADAGAEVIKVESPGVGEPARLLGPFTTGERGEREGAYFGRLNRDKKSVTVNLKAPAGRQILHRLIGAADVFLTNLRPDAVEKLGLSYAALRDAHPRLVYVAISGFGHRDLLPSPYSNWPAFDMLAQGLGGLMDQVGMPDGPPTWLGIPLGDLYPGTLAAYGAMLALFQRLATGRGQLVDVAMYDAMMLLNERSVVQYAVTKEVPRRGSGHDLFAPYGPFKTKDGYVVIAVATEDMWKRLCEVMGRPELAADPRFASGVARVARLDSEVRPLLEGWLADQSAADVTRLLQEAGVPAGPVQTAAEFFSCPHVEARKMLVEVKLPLGGRLVTVGSPVKLESTIDVDPPRPVPCLGQHTEEVLTSLLGLEPAQVDQLRREGIL